jgi:hypothetical protein
MTRLEAIALMFALIGCRGDVMPKDSTAVRDSSTVKNATTGAVNPLAYEDSVLDALLPDRSAVTRSGDTLVYVGGGMLDENYGAAEYKKNGARYVRIAQLLGNKPDGWPIWSTRARTILPPMDSTQALLFGGMCGINDKSDPYVLAIPAPGRVDAVYRDIRHAWRFDRETETLREIPTANVVCWDVGED